MIDSSFHKAPYSSYYIWQTMKDNEDLMEN
jgi:hypothetical protein